MYSEMNVVILKKILTNNIQLLLRKRLLRTIEEFIYYALYTPRSTLFNKKTGYFHCRQQAKSGRKRPKRLTII